GAADIITGAGPTGGPHVGVRDGTNVNNVLYSFFAFDSTYTGGIFVAGGDLDGDNKADIIASQGSGANARLRTFRGSTGAMVGDFVAFNGTGSPDGVRVAAEDRDGDGKLDVYVGSGPGSTSRARTFKGTTFAQIDEFMAYDPSFQGGIWV